MSARYGQAMVSYAIGRTLGKRSGRHEMSIRVEAYTAGGVATGVIARTGPIRDVLDGSSDVVLERSNWLPLDGTAARQIGEVRIAVDDLFLVVVDQPDTAPVHAQWHAIDLDAGPYRVHGEMPTMPGFDPGRALARPNGEFVLLRDAHVELIGRADAGEAVCAEILVNRYTVDRIEADLMLGFFFPGAAMTVTGSSAGGTEQTGSVGSPSVPATA